MATLLTTVIGYIFILLRALPVKRGAMGAPVAPFHRVKRCTLLLALESVLWLQKPV
jgi:hypothetical protein